MTAPTRRILPLFWVLLALLRTAGVASDETLPTTLEIRGRWILDTEGKPVAPESFRRGLQPSGLVWRNGVLSSIGDQRSQFPGRLFRIDPTSARLVGTPGPLTVTPAQIASSRHFAGFAELPNPDFEGITLHPGRSGTLFAVTEDKLPWIAELRSTEGRTGRPPHALAVSVVNLTELRFPAGLTPWRGKTNFRIEGIAVSDDASDDTRTVYLAYERAADDLPRILTTSLAATRSGKTTRLEILPIDFASLPRRSDKKRALLNINDIQFLRHEGAPYLIAVARDQERLLLIDLEARKVARRIDLELRDPRGRAVHWVSPEGLAFDEKSDRLWIVNDPDSVRGNYKLLGEESASGHFASYAPLLFETRLSTLFPPKKTRRVR